MAIVTVVNKAGRDKLVITDVAGVATTDANEKQCFSGDKVGAGNWVDMGPWEGGEALVQVIETGGAAGATVRAYSPEDPTSTTTKNATPTQLGDDYTLAASGKKSFILNKVGTALRMTIQRPAGTNTTVAFRITVTKPNSGAMVG
jgi:hypothetical protein